MIEHRSLVNLLADMASRLNFTQGDSLLSVSTPCFDISLLEILLPLAAAGLVEVASRDAFSDVRVLINRLESKRFTWLFSTPSRLDLLLHGGWQGDPALNVLTGGEQLSQSLSVQLATRCCSLWNLYGPTEATILSTAIEAIDQNPGCCIGRPVSNTQVYVLDSHRELLPIGVPGELYIGGDGLARGYLNRPDLTAERFVPNPFSKDSDSKLYRTGDLCRWKHDGTLEYLGRIDHQVKLRGFRIELGEIEAMLGSHSSIAQCVVVLREDRPGDKRLVAYYTRHGDPNPSIFELREFLGSKLPEYMIPAAFVRLDTLPLTPSGKIDRRALPLPDIKDVGVQDQYTPARNGIEEQLVQVWSEVLGIERIGVHDNFFALGGHSLLAVRLTSRISEIFDIPLGVRLIFEQPTIAQLSAQIDAKRIGGSTRALLPLRSVFRDPEEPAPVSYAQERLWFLEQLEGSLTAYNIPIVWQFRGPLDNEALRKALETIVARHEPLRTVFFQHGNIPVQMVRGLERFELNVEDLRGLDPEDQRLKAAQICHAQADCPFDLTCDLMIRAKLLRLDDQEHQLLVTMHHIASDGWSMDVFTKELSALYGHYLDASTETSGITSGIIPLDPLPVTYIDYSAWQKETLSADRIEGLLSYWRQELKGLPALEFPTDRPRPLMASYRGSSVPIELNESLTLRLESLAQSQQVTLQMLLLAAYEVLLCRYSHQEDFAVGIPFAGRNDTQLENLIGFFVSTLVIRADLTGEPTFQELLSRVSQKSLAAYDHQELPFQVLLADLQPERHMSRPPLFQVMFQLLTQDTSGLNLQGLDLIEKYFSTERVKFDLEMYLRRDQGDISGTLNFSTDLFDLQSIERMAAQYVRLLESIVAQPNQKIGQFSILTDQERDRLLIEFNDTACEYPRELCVHELFEQQVERTPDAVALVFEDQQLSYSELNARANRLARYLRKHGVGEETPVGLCIERSLDLVVSILGILKAGGTYVPLDADYPVKRLENMLELAEVKHLVTQSQLDAKLPSTKRLDICIDRDANEIASEDSSNLDLAYNSNRLAYIIFTSGSTGQPKGVMIEHRSLSNLLYEMRKQLRLSGCEHFICATNPTFDASVWELLTPLVSGCKLEVLSQATISDPVRLAKRLETPNATHFQTTPSRWKMLVQSGWQGDSNLTALSGGESLSFQLLSDLNERCKSAWNLYGPTEATCQSTLIALTPGITNNTIGRPISNTQVYVLDSHRELLPIGVPGELYIGGDGLARGYLNRPDLTAERFVPNPFSKDSDSKLYRTGDLCRWRDDGTLEYLGRIDHQVKLRGFRIELGEIESVLSQHPSIAQCVVILREDCPGDKRLVAYYTQCGEQHPSVLELREFLGSKLPEYMVPAAFVRLDALPLTPSGKIDRRGLPVPDIKDVGVQDQYTPPRNELEEQLAQIWSEVLGIERVGIHDNFFALGGHSLMAVRLFSEINNRLGHELPLSILFQQGTISQIAQMINESPKDQPIARIVQLSDSKEGPALVVMPGLNGELLYSKELVDRIEGRYNVVGLQPNLDPEFLETYADFSRTATEYLRIIRSHQAQGPYKFLGYSYGGILGFEIARQLEEQGQVVDFCGVIDTGIEPDLSYRKLGSVAVHLARVSINIPRWITASCGPNHFRKTVARANRKVRYLGRTLLARGKTKYTIDDEFGIKKSKDHRRKVLGCLFESFNDYKPKNYCGRVTLFRAATRPLYRHLSPDLGWSGIATHVDVHPVPGDHETILRSASIERISKVIRESI
jgi:amino acid adenylation domain-containing protein